MRVQNYAISVVAPSRMQMLGTGSAHPPFSIKQDPEVGGREVSCLSSAGLDGEEGLPQW